MKKVIIITAVAVGSFIVGTAYQDNKRNIDNRIQLQELHIKKSNAQYKKDIDRLHFEIKRQDMLELYENAKGFEKKFTFWDTVQFVKVDNQF